MKGCNYDIISGYMGLTKPYDTTWADGREVVVFPNGDVIEKSTGYYVRKGTTVNQFKEPQLTFNTNQGFSGTQSDTTKLIIFGVLIVAIVAIMKK